MNTHKYNKTTLLFEDKLKDQHFFEQTLLIPEISKWVDDCDSKVYYSSQKINDLRYINRFLHEINSKINLNEFYVGYFETFTSRKNRYFLHKIPVLKYLFQFFDFLYHRVFPKIYFFKTIYFAFTGGKNRILSKAEVLGRLVYNGFEIEKVASIEGITYFKVRKERNLSFEKKVNYGLIFSMKRIGKHGKYFSVYKLRTMHPYSEYIQEYVMKEQGFANTGKFTDDFRLTPWGKVLRKYWLDELPQLFNILKGDMKLVGVRPVSESYFKQLPKDLQEKRIKMKPGCIPPYVSMNSKSNVISVLESERSYLALKLKKPYTTDLKFFFFALINIIFKGKRSA